MTKLTRRSLLCASAASLTAALQAKGADVAGRRENEIPKPGDVTELEWTAVHVNLAYLKSQKKLIEPAIGDLTALFPRRVPVELDKNFDGLPGFMFFLEITPIHLGSKPSWTFIHNKDGSILLATDSAQLSIALKHLNMIARKGPARADKHPAYPRSIPLVVELPIGVRTSMSAQHIA